MTDDRASNSAGAPAAREAARLLDALKRARSFQQRGAADAPPWYLLIGPPGAGKTSALAHSGLAFSEAGQSAEQPGAGDPTGAYQYWFAEEAALVDASGRAVLPAGGGEAESAAWRGYLQLLKRQRPRRPLNGVVVTIGLDALANAASEERRRLARAIRGRLRDLDAILKQRLPVYVVITKIDRLAGFSAFFDALSPSARDQVWGFTLPLAEGEAADLADRFAAAFDRLAERLDAMLPARLQAEDDWQWRSQAFAFPREFALLAPWVQEMLSEIATPSHLGRPPRLRGFYFTSAQLGGASIDPLAQTLSARFGVGLPPLNPARGAAESLFLRRLFTEVVFREQNLVSAGSGEPGLGRVGRIVAGIAVAFALALGLFWWFAYSDQQRLLGDAQARLAAYRDAARNVAVRDVADADLAGVERALEYLRGSPQASPAYRWAGPLGFDRSGALRAAQNDLYGRALDSFLLPRILVGLQQAMQSPRRTPREEESDAKAYLMLGGRSALDQNFARAALASLFDRLVPGADRQALRRSLNDDAAALLGRPPARVALDETFVEDASARLATAASP